MLLDMPRLSLSQRSVEEERERTWLRALEDGDTTVQELSHVTGLSVRRVQERLQRARENREEIDADDDGERDDSALPYLAITDDPRREKGDWYEPESGAASRDSGLVRIGNHNGTRLLVRPINGGSKALEQIKQHQPDPDGLRGGVG